MRPINVEVFCFYCGDLDKPANMTRVRELEHSYLICENCADKN